MDLPRDAGDRAGTYVQPFFLLYLTGPRHLSLATAGTVMVVWNVGAVLSQPIAGVCADRFGRRPTLAAGLLASAGVVMSLAFVRELPLLVGLIFVLGLVADVHRPAVTAAIADLVPERDQVRAYAIQFWAVNLGFTVAAASAGLLLSLGYTTLFVIDSLSTFVFGVLMVRFLPETRPATEHAPARIGDPVRLLTGDRRLAVTALAILVYALIYLQVGIYLPLAVTGAGLDASFYGYLLALSGFVLIVGQPLTLGWISRVPLRHTMLPGMALTGLGVAASALCRSPWEFALSVCVWTVGEMITAGSGQALVAKLAPAHLRGRYGGVLGLSWAVAGLLGPVVGTAGRTVPPVVATTACGAAGLLAAAGIGWVLTRTDRQPVPEPGAWAAE
ncbi:MDR family MFS transporter [Kitasatospora gansuensis]